MRGSFTPGGQRKVYLEEKALGRVRRRVHVRAPRRPELRLWAMDDGDSLALVSRFAPRKQERAWAHGSSQ